METDGGLGDDGSGDTNTDAGDIDLDEVDEVNEVDLGEGGWMMILAEKVSGIERMVVRRWMKWRRWKAGWVTSIVLEHD